MAGVPNKSERSSRSPRPRWRVTLRHEPHVWVFAFDPEDAPGVLKRLNELARDPHAPFDWCDALLLRRRIARLQSESPLPQSHSGLGDAGGAGSSAPPGGMS
jgi:hypothetical protein